jgi:PAS domain S-box-containing protein
VTPRENEVLRQENEALRRRLAEAEQVNQALTSGEIDAVVDTAHQAPLLLRQAQEALRESEERYRVLFDGSPLPMWLFDQETLAIAAVNEAAVRHYGYSREEFLSKTMLEIWHPDEVAAAIARLADPSGDPWSGVRRHFRKGGASIIVEVFSHTVQLAGRPYRLSAVRDITDLTRVEAQRERLAALVEASSDFIGFADPKTAQIQYINKGGRKMCGLGEGEDVGKLKIGDVHPAWMNERMVEVILPAAVRDGVWEGEGAFLHRNGREIPVLMTLLAGKAANGEVEYFYTVSRDITEMKRLEAQFLQVQKMDAVGRLAGGVAHDFNNLLTVMLGYSDVLLTGLEPGPLHEATQEIRRAAERAAALTRQLLAFSRKQTLVPEVLDLGDLVRGMSTMVKRLIGEEIKVRVVVSPNLGRVKADRGQLGQVVMNLAINARDAMPKGGSLLFELQDVELDAAYAATHEVEPGPYVLLAISDTGTGMDVETQRRVFEPFFTTKEAGKGTGLGLSTVHGIVHQSGGSIDVHSERGRGTTFKVYLPRFSGDAVPQAVSGIHPALAAGSETILVVEDEAAIRQLTKIILQKAGYSVLLAESPVAAERMAGSHPGPIHLMLTDVVMPDMRGPELAERLLRQRPDLRVLYMSGYTDDAIAHHGMLDAGTEFLQKPFTPLGLMQKIREVLGRAGP